LRVIGSVVNGSVNYMKVWMLACFTMIAILFPGDAHVVHIFPMSGLAFVTAFPSCFRNDCVPTHLVSACPTVFFITRLSR
jgi:hypothetical protein